MKWIKLFEDFQKPEGKKPEVKNNNQEGTLIKEEDVRKCIESNGRVYAKTINNLKDTKTKDIKHKEEDPLKPVDCDDESVTVNLNGDTFEIEFKNIIKIEY